MWLRTSPITITPSTTTTAQGAEERPQKARRDPSVRSAAPHAEIKQRLLPALRRAWDSQGHMTVRAELS